MIISWQNTEKKKRTQTKFYFYIFFIIMAEIELKIEPSRFIRIESGKFD